jgi:hypothetical protein
MSRLFFIARAMLIVLLVSPTVTHASSYTGTLRIDCTGFGDPAPNTVTFDRDNTGTGQEAYAYLATDGAGTTIFTFSNQLALGSYTLGSSPPFSPPPAVNPITVTLTSLAGNGLLAQTIFTRQGICGNLVKVPTLSEWGVITLAGLLAMAALFGLRRRRQ